MSAVLIGVGVALILFGAFVLLRYSDRPGGTLKWLGLEVSSGGAGLPLIALGIGCILFASFGVGDSSTNGAPGAADAEIAAPTLNGSRQGVTTNIDEVQASADSSDCLSTLFRSIPSGAAHRRDREGRSTVPAAPARSRPTTPSPSGSSNRDAELDYSTQPPEFWHGRKMNYRMISPPIENVPRFRVASARGPAQLLRLGR